LTSSRYARLSCTTQHRHTKDAGTSDHCSIANQDWAIATSGSLRVLDANSATGHDGRNDPHSIFPRRMSSRLFVRKNASRGWCFAVASADGQRPCIPGARWVHDGAWRFTGSTQRINGSAWWTFTSTWWTWWINVRSWRTSGRTNGSAKWSFQSSIREFVAGPCPSWNRWKHAVTNEAISLSWSSSSCLCKSDCFWFSSWGGFPLSSWVDTSNGCFGTTSSSNAACCRA